MNNWYLLTSFSFTISSSMSSASPKLSTAIAKNTFSRISGFVSQSNHLKQLRKGYLFYGLFSSKGYLYYGDNWHFLFNLNQLTVTKIDTFKCSTKNNAYNE